MKILGEVVSKDTELHCRDSRNILNERINCKIKLLFLFWRISSPKADE